MSKAKAGNASPMSRGHPSAGTKRICYAEGRGSWASSETLPSMLQSSLTGFDIQIPSPGRWQAHGSIADLYRHP